MLGNMSRNVNLTRLTIDLSSCKPSILSIQLVSKHLKEAKQLRFLYVDLE